LECVGETLRRVLDDLARWASEWLRAQITPDWFDRYGRRVEAYRLPKDKTQQAALQQQIGQDGAQLFQVLWQPDTPAGLRTLPTAEVLRQVWLQQYYTEDGCLRWREVDELPPHKWLIVSPDDRDARNCTKRDTNWTGYLARLTETCGAASPHFITHVETTSATTTDDAVGGTIHQDLAAKDLLPAVHLVDAGYTAVDTLQAAEHQYQIDLLGPVRGGGSWQAVAGHGFDVSCFAIDWERQVVTCPQGQCSQSWHVRQEKYGHEYIVVQFSPSACQACPHQPDCTCAKRDVRTVTFKPQAAYETLQAARARQETATFKQQSKKRAGIEGTLSQGTRAFGLRCCRYLGLAKTHLQHLATAAAMNLTRLVHWLADEAQSPEPYRSPFAALAPS
jgi:transposase